MKLVTSKSTCVNKSTFYGMNQLFRNQFFCLWVRRMLIRKNLEFSPRPFVRSSVRSQRVFSESLHYFFSETFQLVRACKGGKNFPSAFLKKNPVLSILANNCPKLAIFGQNAKNGGFSHFSRNPFINFF